MYLIDTNVISECRKGIKANNGVKLFFYKAVENGDLLFLSVITLGELRRDIDLIRYRGDVKQALLLERWFENLLVDYEAAVLDFGKDEAQLWGALRVPYYENAIDIQISVIALTNDLTVVTRNIRDFEKTGLRLLNPFD
ncbi:VapC toxin family PIN domain ribonuclease [Gammaproteobacteria bacterium 53_120_T64]|nr:VapC toxin family PIN domain ribonuclease [Gammaproteobacteria bacterium 53_120_T64]